MCWEEATVRKDGRISAHFDGIGTVCPMSYRDKPPWDEPSTRVAVKGRGNGYCEFCQLLRASEMHHRVGRGVGGPWSPENIVYLCKHCHDEATHHPNWAWGLGLIVKSHENPGRKPVTREDGSQFQPSNEVIR